MYETHVGFLHTADLIFGILIAFGVLASQCILITKIIFRNFSLYVGRRTEEVYFLRYLDSLFLARNMDSFGLDCHICKQLRDNHNH